MRLAIFSFAVFSTALLFTAKLPAAQAPYEVADEHEVVMADGDAPAGYYAYRASLGWGVANSNWGYGGTCCSNVWDGYCAEQSCHRPGCHNGSLRCKLKCMRIKIFGSKSCGCQHCGCQSHGNPCCGHGCGAAHPGEMTAPAADYESSEPLEAMPMPPQARSSRAAPSSEAARRARDSQTIARQSWSMPRMSSGQGSQRR